MSGLGTTRAADHEFHYDVNADLDETFRTFRQRQATFHARVRRGAAELQSFLDETAALRAREPWWRRALDLAGASAALVLLAPFIAAIAALVLAESGRPVLHSALRFGKGNARFGCLYFRTTVESDDGIVQTRVGRFLWRTGLHGLPQLFNVLRGEMSLVGPKALSARELAALREAGFRPYAVRPGVTGPWRIHPERGLFQMQDIEAVGAEVASLVRYFKIVAISFVRGVRRFRRNLFEPHPR